jgi:hypothetical protein
MVELTNVKVTSGSRHLLVAEIGKPPLKTNENKQKTYERYTIGTEHVLDTNRKPLSHYRLVTSLPISGVT